MNALEIRDKLINNPSKEFLIEILNSAQLPNPLLKSVLFMALQKASQAEVIRFSNIAAVAIQYLMQNDMPGLKTLMGRVGVPEPFINMIVDHVANLNPK